MSYLEKVFRVNLYAYVQLATSFLSSLQSAEHFGSVVVVSSVLGRNCTVLILISDCSTIC